MEKLTFNINKSLDTSNFVRIGDLSYFEGPLLSLFEELNSGHLYLLDWVDRDEKSNRWLIYRASPNSLLQFINCKISHLELFQNRPEKEVYFADIDSRNKLFSSYNSYAVESLPESYYPNNENFFELSDCNHFEKIKSVIINALSKRKTENEYSTVYSVRVLKRSEVKSAYFNRVRHKISSVAFPVRHLDYTDILTLSNLSLNNIKGVSLKTYPIVKKHQTQNKKQYANQYN
ncbi:MAG: hypothetical protein KDE33_14760 [Bacteroidetes bacterium]|nr:hypothetical protein [Bacteroidota bacterium]